MRLCIIGPTLDRVPAQFAVDLALLYATTRESGRWPNVTMDFVPSTYVHVGREYLLDRAVRQGATHVFWIDTDMEFPPETAIRLSRHDLPVVACNCVTRHPHRRLYTAVKNGERIPTLRDSFGIEEVDSIGLAVMLMRTDVLAELPRPWFSHGWDAEKRADIGEDIMFCRALRSAGVPIFIDHDVSKEIGHIGSYTYRTLETRTEEVAVAGA